ncbi:MAG: S-layer homology domain-containing protein [Clostridium sp.]|nr:S-layer homology domain-containing protein [Clostridium sp.]
MKKARFKTLFVTLFAMIVLISSIGTASAVKLSDVEGHPAQKAIEALVDAGAIAGCPDGTFKGELSVTRAQFALILNQYLGFSSTDAEEFSDVPAGQWYSDAMLTARSAGYIVGTGDNMGCPTYNITRQEAFTMVAKLYGLAAAGEAAGVADWAQSPVAALIGANVISADDLRPAVNMTRAEAAQLIYDAVEKLGKPSTKINSIDVLDITQKDIFNEKTNTASVQSDIYGVLIKADAAAQITVTSDKTTYDDEGTLKYTAGEAIPYNTQLGGYIVPLSEAYTDYDVAYVQTATIKTFVDGKSEEQIVTINRACDKEIHDLFQKKTYSFDMGEAGVLEMNYTVYYPSNFDESKEYPVVLVLHGSGQMEYMPGYPSTDMIVKRNQAALAWAKDSEKGINECIVVAPQISYYMTPDTPMWGGGAVLMPFGLAAYDLLENEFIAKDYVDEDRIYVTGLSLGGVGTYAMIGSHPETFAGAIIACGATYEDWYGGYDYSALAPLSGSIYLTHAKGDPEVDFMFYEQSTAGMQAAGIEYETKVWTAEEIFYPHAHYSWTPTYADETIRNWLFEQAR